MISFDWERFWQEHPVRHLKMGNVKWANLRPATYDVKKAFAEIDHTLHIVETDSVLEIGCGTGEMLPLIKTPHLIATDLSQAMVNEAHINNPNIPIIKAPMHLLPFTDESFDKIFCLGVIQYIPPTLFKESIYEALRVLKIGGILFVGDVSTNAPKDAEVFDYPKEQWEQFGDVGFSQSSFENRLNVIITKSDQKLPSILEKKDQIWGTA